MDVILKIPKQSVPPCVVKFERASRHDTTASVVVSSRKSSDSILIRGNDAKRLIQTSYGNQKTAMGIRVIPTKRYTPLTTAYTHKRERRPVYTGLYSSFKPDHMEDDVQYKDYVPIVHLETVTLHFLFVVSSLITQFHVSQLLDWFCVA